MTKPVQLIVCDMAGTTVTDRQEVEKCFIAACEESHLPYQTESIIAMMGWSKIKVFTTLWTQALGDGHPDIAAKVDLSYQAFTRILNHHYQNEAVSPTPGTLELFEYCRQNGIAIGLTTGFYREVTNIILQKLGWLQGLNPHYIGDSTTLIQSSVCSDEVSQGRPAPDMIFKTMQQLSISDPQAVINIGDTPSDLESGKRAGVRMSIGITNGTHTAEQLAAQPNDGLVEDMFAFRVLLQQVNAGALAQS